MEVLVSVNSVAEAQLVLNAGVKWLDLKDTSHGALASLSTQISEKIIQSIQSFTESTSQKVTVSATIGDIFDDIHAFKSQLEEKFNLGIDIIKIPYQAISLFENADELRELFGHIRKQFNIIVVFTPQTLLALEDRLAICLEKLKLVGVYGVMLDTSDKSKNLFESVEVNQLQLFVQVAKHNGFFVGLAGGLQTQHLEILSKLNLDIVGYRSGISEENNRKLGLSSQFLQLLIKKCGENTN